MKLIVKTHPRYLTWLISDEGSLCEPEFGTLALQSNFLKNYENLKQLFSYLNTKYKTISFVGFENPHIELPELSELPNSLVKPKLNIIKDIQHMQRVVACIIVLSWEALSVQANSLIHTTKLTLDEKLALVDSRLSKGLKKGFYSDLEKLCLAECIMLMDDINALHPVTARIINKND